MGSTSYIGKKPVGYKAKSGSSVGSDKDISGKLRRAKIRRPAKMTEFGVKRVPDYTELAYKEAVSKLRYFLSGNYAPSARSYVGSASIKNLDESDADIDKKFSSYALTEYKPRPRLTAKYATLYADSLNNYGAKNLGNATQPLPAETSASNPDVINFIQKQEEYIEQLERESQYCRDELNNLLVKVKEVISENENLHEAQKNKLITRMFHSYNPGSETDDLDDSTGLDSDNKVSPSKGRRAGKAKFTKLEGPNIVFESRIAELEAQLTQAKIDMKKVQEENNENKRKLASGLVDSTCLDGFKRQIDNLQRDKSSLESQISKLKLSLEQSQDYDGKYKRSDAVENQLREERNNLEVEIRRLKEDLSSERSKVHSLAGEGARRALQERSAAEHRYNQHFDELQHDLAAQYDNVAKLQLELERQRREENELKRELTMKNSAIEDLKMELKNKLASLQADLAQAHAEKASLEEELASARLAIERQQRQAKHDTNRLNSEIQSLRQRLDRADADLVHSRRENLRLSEQISTLEKEINMKTLTPMTPEKKKKEKELSTMLESMENKHAKTVAELETMIQSQNSLMEKLTGECRSLTDKLDDANRRHKEELGHLQRQVEGLGRSLQPHKTSPINYQAPTTHAPAASRIPETMSGAGHEYTGSDPARDALDREESIVRANGAFRPNLVNGSSQRVISKQNSRASLHQESAVVKEPMEVEKDHVQGKYQSNTDYQNEAENHELKETPQEADTEFHGPNPEHLRFEQNPVANYEEDYNHSDTAQHQSQGYEEPTTDYEQQGYEQPPYPEGQYEQYEQYTDPNAQQYSDPNAQQYNDPNTEQYNDPNAQQYTDPNAQEYDPNAQQYTDPNAQQYNDPSTEQYNDPNAQQYSDPNAQQYADPNSQQYSDPNAQQYSDQQYQGEYTDYAKDPNYQPQNYENPEYAQVKYSEPEKKQEKIEAESKRSNSPNEKKFSPS